MRTRADELSLRRPIGGDRRPFRIRQPAPPARKGLPRLVGEAYLRPLETFDNLAYYLLASPCNLAGLVALFVLGTVVSAAWTSGLVWIHRAMLGADVASPPIAALTVGLLVYFAGRVLATWLVAGMHTGRYPLGPLVVVLLFVQGIVALPQLGLMFLGPSLPAPMLGLAMLALDFWVLSVHSLAVGGVYESSAVGFASAGIAIVADWTLVRFFLFASLAAM